MKRLLAFALLLLPILSPVTDAQVSPQADLLARLAAARDATNLADRALKPWHLVAGYDLLDVRGAVKEHGTFEEWWAAPDIWRQHFTSPSFNYDHLRIGSQRFTDSQGRIPYFLSVMIQDLVEPIPGLAHETPTISSEDHVIGKLHLNCLLTDYTRDHSLDKPSAPPTYCFDPRTNELRFALKFGLEQVVLNRPGHFQGKTVNLDVTILEAGKAVLRANTAVLQTLPPGDAPFTPKEGITPVVFPTHVPASVIAGRKLKGPAPVYPAFAERAKIQGVVLLDAEITSAGTITLLEPIYAADPTLLDAAVSAVKHWVYEPYLVNGKPTMVSTQIRVNFILPR